MISSQEGSYQGFNGDTSNYISLSQFVSDLTFVT